VQASLHTLFIAQDVGTDVDSTYAHVSFYICKMPQGDDLHWTWYGIVEFNVPLDTV